MRKEFSAGAIVYFINEELQKPEYLTLHYGASHWDFPKGKLEPGETNEQAAYREVKEETGLSLTFDPGFEHHLFYKFRSREGELISKEVTFYAAQAKTRDVILSHEHTDFRWLSYEETRHILTYDNAVNLLDVAHAFITGLHNL